MTFWEVVRDVLETIEAFLTGEIVGQYKESRDKDEDVIKSAQDANAAASEVQSDADLERMRDKF